MPTCPNCRASLDDDLVDRTGEARCSFCGADVSDLYPPAGGFETPSPTDAFGDAAFDEHAIAEHEGEIARRPRRADVGDPPGSHVQVVERTDDRLVIAIPPGGRGSRGLGYFAVFWLGFMTVFTGFAGGIGFVGLRQKLDWEAIFPALFITLFWLIGFGLAYGWARMRFMTTFLLLEPDRLVVQRRLLGRKTTRETQLGPESRAGLDVSYSQNDVPVYHVELKGTNRTEKFGVQLGDEEKAWFVRTINTFLHGPQTAEELAEGFPGGRLSSLANEMPREGVAPLAPHELPADSPVRIDDSWVDGLRFSLPALTGGLANGCGYGCGCTGAAFLAGAAGLVAYAVNEGDWFAAIPAVMLTALGLGLSFVGIVAKRSRVMVEVDGDRLRMRWGLGPLGFNRRVPLTAISHVGLGTTYESSTNGKLTTRAKGCIVRAAGQSYPLTTNHGEEVGRQVGGLLRYELDRRGVVLQDLP